MEDDSSSGPGRREALTAVGAAAGLATLPGCTALWDQTGATDVILDSAATEPRTVSVTITPEGTEEPHTSRTLALEPGETVDPVNRSKLPTNSGYTVEVGVEDGPSETFEWTDPTLELAPLWVRVDDTENVAFLLQAG